MKLPVRLLPEARAEFDEATDRYEQQRPGLGATFVARVREVFGRIAADPRRHPAVYLDVRKTLVRKFPYVVLYRGGTGRGRRHLGIAYVEGSLDLEVPSLTCLVMGCLRGG
jgi:hypothetical protein